MSGAYKGVVIETVQCEIDSLTGSTVVNADFYILHADRRIVANSPVVMPVQPLDTSPQLAVPSESLGVTCHDRGG